MTTETRAEQKDVTYEPAGLAAWAAKWLDVGSGVAFLHADEWYYAHTDGAVTKCSGAPTLGLFVPVTREQGRSVGATDLARKVEDKLQELGFDFAECKYVDGATIPWSASIGRLHSSRGHANHRGFGPTYAVALLRAARHAVEGGERVYRVAMQWSDEESLESAKTAATIEMRRVVRDLFLNEPPVGATIVGNIEVDEFGLDEVEWRKYVEERVAKLAPTTVETTTDDGDPPKAAEMYDPAIVGFGQVLGKRIWVYDVAEVGRITREAHPTASTDVAAELVAFEFGKDRGPRSPILLNTLHRP